MNVGGLCDDDLAYACVNGLVGVLQLRDHTPLNHSLFHIAVERLSVNLRDDTLIVIRIP